MIYRTAGAWGAGKGGNLTPVEIDENFFELRQDIDGALAAIPSGVGIDNIAVVGTQMTITLTDASTLGPFTLPRATFRYRGDWTAANNYFGNDFVSVPGDGIYVVLQAHTSDSTFDADREISSEPVYLLIYSEPRSAVVSVATSTFDPLLTHIWAFMVCSGACEVFVPANADVAFPIGSELHFHAGSAAVSITPETGVTLSIPPGFLAETAQEGAVLTLKKILTNTWVVFGWLAVDPAT